MKIKITSDGTPANTKIINAETGAAVENIVAVDFVSSNGAKPKVRVTFELPVNNYVLELPMNV